MPELYELAKDAIGLARSVLKNGRMLTALAAAKKVEPRELALEMLDELEAQLGEVTKTIDGKQRPAGDFLVVEDSEKPSTWHLPVKVNGTPDHRLMGAAKAALTSPGGHRGRKYAGPDKEKAISKLKALYKSEDMEWTESAAAEVGEYAEVSTDAEMHDDYGPLTFEDLDAEEEARQAAAEASKRVYQYHRLIDSVMRSPDVEDKAVALMGLAQEFVSRVAMDARNEEGALTEADAIEDYGQAVEVARDATAEDTASLTEAEAATVDTGRRAPVVIDFQVLKPGPGNKRDNHFYPADVVERDIHVFDGVDVFATDHRENERSERTKVGKVLKCPARFIEDRAPVARVLLYDPGQAEKARNRADAGELATLECSIYGNGRAKSGEVNGKKYKVVEAITEGKYLELVSKAGAGGHALNLAESHDGGDEMKDENKGQVAEETAHDAQPPENEVAEVSIAEATEPEGAQETPETVEEGEQPEQPEQVFLAEAEIDAMLKEAKLPDNLKAVLGKAQYTSADELSGAIAEAVEMVKAITKSGQPVATRKRGGTYRHSPRARLAEIEAAQASVNAKYLGVKPRQKSEEA